MSATRPGAPGGAAAGGGEANMLNPLNWDWKVQLAAGGLLAYLFYSEYQRAKTELKDWKEGKTPQPATASSTPASAAGGVSDALTASAGPNVRNTSRGVEVTVTQEQAQQLAEWQQLTSLIEAAQEQRRYDQAEIMLRRGIEILTGIVGPDNMVIAHTSQSLGFALKEQGKFVESLKAYDNAVRIKAEVLGRDHTEVGETLAAMADLLLLMGDAVNAQKLVERALVIFSQADEDQGLNVAATHDILASILKKRGEFEEAKEHFGIAFEQFKGLKLMPHASGCKIKLAQLCRELGDFEGAKEHYNGLLEYLKSSPTFSETDALYYSTLNQLASLHWDFEKPVEAAAFEQTVIGLDVAPPNTYSRYLTTDHALFVFALPPPDVQVPDESIEKQAYAHFDLRINMDAWSKIEGFNDDTSEIKLHATLEPLGERAGAQSIQFEGVIKASDCRNTRRVTLTSEALVPYEAQYLAVIRVINNANGELMGQHRQLCRSPLDLHTATIADIRELAKGPNTIIA